MFVVSFYVTETNFMQGTQSTFFSVSVRINMRVVLRLPVWSTKAAQYRFPMSQYAAPYNLQVIRYWLLDWLKMPHSIIKLLKIKNQYLQTNKLPTFLPVSFNVCFFYWVRLMTKTTYKQNDVKKNKLANVHCTIAVHSVFMFRITIFSEKY